MTRVNPCRRSVHIQVHPCLYPVYNLSESLRSLDVCVPAATLAFGIASPVLRCFASSTASPPSLQPCAFLNTGALLLFALSLGQRAVLQLEARVANAIKEEEAARVLSAQAMKRREIAHKAVVRRD